MFIVRCSCIALVSIYHMGRLYFNKTQKYVCSVVRSRVEPTFRARQMSEPSSVHDQALTSRAKPTSTRFHPLDNPAWSSMSSSARRLGRRRKALPLKEGLTEKPYRGDACIAKGKQQDHPRDNNTTLKWTHAQCVTTNARSTRPRIAHIPRNPRTIHIDCSRAQRLHLTDTLARTRTCKRRKPQCHSEEWPEGSEAGVGYLEIGYPE